MALKKVAKANKLVLLDDKVHGQTVYLDDGKGSMTEVAAQSNKPESFEWLVASAAAYHGIDIVIVKPKPAETQVPAAETPLKQVFEQGLLTEKVEPTND